MNGIRLGELDSSDMLDVLHYFFEEDTNFVSKEHAVYTDARRKKLYEVLYETEYGFGMSEKDGANSYVDGGTKPYIPPTEFDADSGLPFSDFLDAPLN